MTIRPRGRRLVPWFVLIFALSAVVSIGPMARPAAAHATLLETTPADDELLDRAPERVVLRFDEPVDVAPSALRVLDRDGNRVDDGTVDRDDEGTTISTAIDSPRLGTYTVAWRVLSEDSHDLSGSFVFHVGERTGRVSVDEGGDTLTDVVAGVARWLAMAGTIVLIGSAVLALVVGRRDTATIERLRRLGLWSALVAVVGVVLLLVTQAAAASGRSLPDALDLTVGLSTDTRTGVLSLWRGGLLLAAGIAVATLRGRRIEPLLATALGAAALVFTAAAGHAWSADDRVVAVIADLIHLGAVSVWVGGLVGLAFTLRQAEDREALARRFSGLALGAVILVAVSGSVSGYEQVGSLEALTGTGYGQLLLLKVVGFFWLVGFGWVNRFRLLGLVRDTGAPLLRSVRLELPVAGAVLVLTAVLIGQAPARTTYSEPFSETVTTEELTVQLDVQPAKAGTNDLHLYFYEVDGLTAAPVDAVEVTASVGDVPPRRLDVTPVTPSHVSVYGAALTSPGTWTISVTAVQAGSPTTTTFEVPLK